MAEELNLFYKLLKAEVPINITSELKETFDSVNRALSDACELALKQPIPGKQVVLLTDASFSSAGYALLIEVNSDKKNPIKEEDVCACRNWINHLLACTGENFDVIERILANLHVNSRV